MMNKQRFLDLLGLVKYKDWTFYVGDTGSHYYLQIQFNEIDVDNPEEGMVVQKCRKWLLSNFMTNSEVITTAWKAVQSAEQHEAAERFTYNGVAIFNPHVSIDNLCSFYRKSISKDYREERS